VLLRPGECFWCWLQRAEEQRTERERQLVERLLASVFPDGIAF
jgi:hypothetical protein